LIIDSAIAQAARFKTQGRTQEIQATAYAVYAHFLSLIVLDASKHLQTLSLPTTAEEVRQAVMDRYKFLNFESLVRYIWSLGIPVIPLEDSGAFHGACWRISGRNVIVLKQITPYQSRWLFDLAHELAHVILHLSEDRTAFIEPEEINPFHDSEEEWDANDFADELLLYGRADELAEMSAEKARGQVKFLKSAVLQIAAAEHVPVDLLANYVAYRLSVANHINWWGAANNLQITDPVPSYLARQVFFEHVNLNQLNPLDQGLVMRAISQE
jgi:Zn-dependent peptidase ImmA (M78 family)